MRYIGSSNASNRHQLFKWMSSGIPDGYGPMPNDFTAMYIADGTDVLGIVGFSMWTKHSVLIHIATDGTKRWATRRFIYEVYRYVFEQCGCSRINAFAAEDNADAINLHLRLGHKLEAVLPHQYGLNKHGLLFGMTIEDWKRSKWNRSARKEDRQVNKAA